MQSTASILALSCTVANAGAHSKKRALELAAELIAEADDGVDARVVFDALLARERLGSTALGDGVAIPHCRVDCNRIIGAFISTETPVDFDAPDDQPVNLIFTLVVPREETDDHLAVLAVLAETFSDPAKRQQLASAQDSPALHELMCGFLDA